MQSGAASGQTAQGAFAAATGAVRVVVDVRKGAKEKGGEGASLDE